MPKHLVIVESPAKARTIERYLGEDYQVLASYGHVRDLPENPGKGKFGVDVDHDFAPGVRHLGGPAQAGRGDREGGPGRPTTSSWPPTSTGRARRSPGTSPRRPTSRPPRRSRVTFNEITEGAIREAFAHPRDIDRNLVDAQQARRIVDRLVGYTLSPLISRKVRPGLSAGRVQSVAVRLVVEREREITAFVAREYWTLEALLATPDGDAVRRRGRPDRRARRSTIGDGDTATRPRRRAPLRSSRSSTRSTTRPSKRNPAPPFTTSTLQQEASRKLGFSPKRTMSVAQRLYEGVGHARRPRRPHHLHADGLDRDRGRRDGRGAGA